MRELVGPEGLFPPHTIGDPLTERATQAWTERYIFPNGKPPSALEITRAAQGQFAIEDGCSSGPEDERTRIAWWACFAGAWPSLRERCGEPVSRLWKPCLLSSAGFFRSRQGQLRQIVPAPRERTRAVPFGALTVA